MSIFDRFKKKGGAPEKSAVDKMKAAEKTLQELKKEEGVTTEKKAKAAKKVLKDNTGSAYRILIRPVITEKSAILADKGKYVFEVSPFANKIEVSKAVKKVYGVTSVKVNMIKLPGQKVLMRSRNFKLGRTKNRYKAVVTLKKGEKIPLFEGA